MPSSSRARIPLADDARRADFLALLDKAAGAKRLSRSEIGKRVIGNYKKWSDCLSGRRAFQPKEFDKLMRVLDPAPEITRRMYELHDFPVPALVSDDAQRLLQKMASQIDRLADKLLGEPADSTERPPGTATETAASEDEALVAGLWKKARDIDWRGAASLRLYESIAEILGHVGTDTALDAHAHVLVLALYAEATTDLEIRWIYKPSDAELHLGRIGNRMRYSSMEEATRGEEIRDRAVEVMRELAGRYRRDEFLVDVTVVATIFTAAHEAMGFGDVGQYEELMVLLRTLNLDSELSPYLVHSPDGHADAERAPGGTLFDWYQRGGM